MRLGTSVLPTARTRPLAQHTLCRAAEGKLLSAGHTLHVLSAGLLALMTVLGCSDRCLGAQQSSWEQLDSAGTAFYKSGQYPEAETQHRAALQQLENAPPDDTRLAVSLNNLAMDYEAEGKYDQAEPLFRRSLEIREKLLGAQSDPAARARGNLAALYRVESRYSEAEALFQETLTAEESLLGQDDPELARTLNNLSVLYISSGRYEEGERAARRALAIYEKARGPGDPAVATCLLNVAGAEMAQGVNVQPLYTRALEIAEKALGPGHPALAVILNSVAAFYQHDGDKKQAESLFRRALAIQQQALGPGSPAVAGTLSNLSRLYASEHKRRQADELQAEANAIAGRTAPTALP